MFDKRDESVSEEFNEREDGGMCGGPVYEMEDMRPSAWSTTVRDLRMSSICRLGIGRERVQVSTTVACNDREAMPCEKIVSERGVSCEVMTRVIDSRMRGMNRKKNDLESV